MDEGRVSLANCLISDAKRLLQGSIISWENFDYVVARMWSRSWRPKHLDPANDSKEKVSDAAIHLARHKSLGSKWRTLRRPTQMRRRRLLTAKFAVQGMLHVAARTAAGVELKFASWADWRKSTWIIRSLACLFGVSWSISSSVAAVMRVITISDGIVSEVNEEWVIGLFSRRLFWV